VQVLPSRMQEVQVRRAIEANWGEGTTTMRSAWSRVWLNRAFASAEDSERVGCLAFGMHLQPRSRHAFKARISEAKRPDITNCWRSEESNRIGD